MAQRRPLPQPGPDKPTEWEHIDGFHVEEYKREDAVLVTSYERATRKCRRPGCRRHAVWALKRSNGWWMYCDWHTYANEIRTDGVYAKRRVRDEVSV